MQLQALGYVDGSFVGDLDGDLLDAKDFLEDILNSQKADHAVREGDFARAESLLRVLSERFPDALEFSNRLAAALSRQGKSEEASATLLKAAERAPDDPSLMAALGVHYARTGEYSKASALFRRAADAMPWAPGLRAMAVASQLSVSNGQEEAINLGLTYLQDFPRDYAVAGLVGVAFAKVQIAEARDLLEVGIRADRPESEVAFYLGLAELGEGKKRRARQLFRKELEHYPKHLQSAVSLVRIEGEYGRNQAVLEVASAGLVHHPSDLNLLLAKAQASFNLKDFSNSRLAVDLALLHHPTSSEAILLDANLLSKEGKPEKGRKRFAEAQEARRIESERRTTGNPTP
ncbi:MAG: tetratricopeptide repeat protein [Myxococcota bacterium]|nr:tetratricopeptide repeat protein [Myxococcota bacterium]